MAHTRHKGELTGDAAGLLKTVNDPKCPPEVLASAIHQLQRLGCVSTTELWAKITSPSVGYDPEQDKFVVHKPNRPTDLQTLGKQALDGILKREQPFKLAPAPGKYAPWMQRFVDTREFAALLRERRSPAERAAAVVQSPDVVNVQLDYAGQPRLSVTPVRTVIEKQGFQEVEDGSPTLCVAQNVATKHGEVTLVTQRIPRGTFGRLVSVAYPNERPTIRRQRVVLEEQQFACVDSEWAAEELPGELFSRLGGLQVQGSLEPLTDLFEDPDVASPLASALWSRHSIVPETNGLLAARV